MPQELASGIITQMDIEHQQEADDRRVNSIYIATRLGEEIHKGVEHGHKPRNIGTSENPIDFEEAIDAVVSGVRNDVITFETAPKDNDVGEDIEVQSGEGEIKVKLSPGLYKRVEREFAWTTDFTKLAVAYAEINRTLNDPDFGKPKTEDGVKIADNLSTLVANKLRGTRDEEFLERPDGTSVHYRVANAVMRLGVKNNEVDFSLSDEVDRADVFVDSGSKQVVVRLGRDFYDRLKHPPLKREDWSQLKRLVGEIDFQWRAVER